MLRGGGRFGKGVAAGLFMAVTRTLIRATAIPGRGPLEILERVNAQLCAENQASLFVTMILGILDTNTGRMVYGQGGHNPPILVPSHGEPVYEPSGGMPLGVFEDAKFGERKLELKAGESLLVYTDGVTEAQDPDANLYGSARLRAIQETVHGQGMGAAGLLTAVSADVARFVDGAEPADDLTILALRWNGPARSGS